MLEKHEKSGNCDPKKKKKPTCLVRWCKEILPFSNTRTCKTFQLKVCFKHRFLADHTCKKAAAATVVEGKGRWNDRFLAAWLRGMEEIVAARVDMVLRLLPVVHLHLLKHIEIVNHESFVCVVFI